MRIALFSGTTEGRELSLQLAGAGYAVTVFVATEYGSEEQGEHAGIEVREPVMDAIVIRNAISTNSATMQSSLKTNMKRN